MEAAPARGAPAVAILLILGTMAIFVTTDTLAKYLMQTYSVAEVTWARFVFHMPVVLALMAAQRSRTVFRSRNLRNQIGRSVTQLASTLLFFLAIAYLPLATAVAIAFVQPLLVTALSVPLLGEKVGPRRWAAVVAGFAGALIIVRPGAGMHWAALLPLCMAFTSGLNQVMTRRVAVLDQPATSLLYNAVLGVAVMSLAAPFDWRPPDGAGWAMLAAVGLLGGAGHMLMILAFARAPASLLAPFSYTQLVWATLFGLVLFGDLPDRWTIIGAAVIVGSGLYVLYRERRQALAAQASISMRYSGAAKAEMTTSVEAGRASPSATSRTAR